MCLGIKRVRSDFVGRKLGLIRMAESLHPLSSIPLLLGTQIKVKKRGMDEKSNEEGVNACGKGLGRMNILNGRQGG